MTNDTNNTTEPTQDELRDRLMELKDQHEAIEHEMESIQAQMDGGDEGEGSIPFQPAPDLSAELEEWKGKYQRALADYQNFQTRAAKNEREARKQGTISLAESLLPVLDNFDLALMGDPATLTVESVLKGIVVTRDELLRVLDTHGVTILEPAPGDEFSPMHHQAVMQQDHDDVAPGAVVASLQKGYAMGERTLRPAKVSVKPQSSGPAPSAGDADADEPAQEGGDDADV